jgi:hypothetical protein
MMTIAVPDDLSVFFFRHCRPRTLFYAGGDIAGIKTGCDIQRKKRVRMMAFGILLFFYAYPGNPAKKQYFYTPLFPLENGLNQSPIGIPGGLHNFECSGIHP